MKDFSFKHWQVSSKILESLGIEVTGQSQESLLQLQLLLYVVKFNALFYLMSNPAEADQEYSLYLHFQMFMFWWITFLCMYNTLRLTSFKCSFQAKDRIQYYQTGEEFIFPYDLGSRWENFKQVFTWSGTPEGDGIEWPINDKCHQHTLTVHLLYKFQ